jgi:tripeptide aminopeptidase
MQHVTTQMQSQLTSLTTATLDEAITIQQIPAPTFDEGARARYVTTRFQAMGLRDVSVDETGNVYGRILGTQRGKPGLMLSAHMDTVFAHGTDLKIQRTEDRIMGAGIGDNSMGVAGLLALAELWREQSPRRDIWVVANVCEEGLGNLRGMRAVVNQLREHIGAAIVLEGGAYGAVIHRGIGVVRYRITVTTPGGHAWSNFGTPSAVHELCKVAADIAALEVPSEPRTSFNIGEIAGGTTINTIASSAHLLLDLRSEEPITLSRLSRDVKAIVAARRKSPEIAIDVEEIGARPAGGISDHHPLVQLALRSLIEVGYDGNSDKIMRAASTDANVPLSVGIPTVCIGLTVGHHAHRLDEYIEIAPLAQGIQHCWLTMKGALAWLP